MDAPAVAASAPEGYSAVVRVDGGRFMRGLESGTLNFDELLNYSRVGYAAEKDKVRTAPDRVHAATYSCMDIRARSVGSVPMVLMKGRRKDAKVVEDGPIAELLERPHPDMSRAEYWHLAQQIMDGSNLGAVMHLKDPYLQGGRVKPFSPRQVPRMLELADPKDYEVIRAEGSSRVTAYRLLSKPAIVYPAHQVIVTRHPSRHRFPFGQSPLEVTRTIIEADVLADFYVKKFIENDCNPSVWIILDGRVTPELVQQTQKMISDRLDGPQNVGGAKVIANIKEIIPNAMTHRDSQFLEGEEARLEKICMVWGVPKSLLGKTADVNKATAWAAKRAFWELTAKFLLDRHADAFTTHLLWNLDGGPYWAAWDTSDVPELQREIGEKAEIFERLTRSGVPRRIAAAKVDLELEQFPGDDVGLVARGLAPIAQVAAGDTAGAETPSPAEPEPEAKALTLEEAKVVSDLVLSVADGKLDPDSAKALLLVSTPLTPEQINAIIDPAVPEEAPEDSSSSPTPPPVADEGMSTSEEENGRTVPSPTRPGRSHNARNRLEKAKRQRRARAEAKKRWQRIREGVIEPRETHFTRKMRGMLQTRRAEVLEIFDRLLAERRSLRVDEPADASDGVFFPTDVDAFQLDHQVWEDRSRERLTDIYEDLARRVADATLADHNPDGFVSDRVVESWQSFTDGRLGKEIRNVDATTLEQVRATFRKGLADGLTPKEIRASIGDLDAFSRERARTIAVTEMGSLANNTRWDQFEDLGIDGEIVWFTSGNDNVRPGHVANEAHGKVQRGTKFPSGARWPHDPAAEASDVIGCHCGFEPAIED